MIAEPSITGHGDSCVKFLVYRIYLIPYFNLFALSIRYPYVIILHDLAIFYAVYNLSPVNIINLIPPCFNEYIVYGT